MTILTDDFAATSHRLADRITHPNWCDERRCTVEALDDALQITHRMDLTTVYTPASDAFTLDGHTRVDLVHEQIVGFASGRVELDAFSVDLVGTPEAELDSCQYVARLLARIAAERVVKAFTGVELNPYWEIAVQSVQAAAAVRGGAR